MARLEDLDLTGDPIDDRWTESKLVAEGFRFNGDGSCRACGEPVSFYLKETLKGKRWKVVEAGSLGEHRCDR